MNEIFDKNQYDRLMSDALIMHVEDRLHEAYGLRRQAYLMAPDRSLEKGSAARDMGAVINYLDGPAEAKSHAVEAYDIHAGIVDDMPRPSRDALRERSASAMYVGVITLRQAIEADLSGEANQSDQKSSLAFLRESWADIRKAKKMAQKPLDRRVDQYEINGAWRVSVAESLFGNKHAGRQIGQRALALAFMSESPHISTSSSSLNYQQIYAAKKKSLAGAVWALGVNTVARFGKPGQRLAKKAVHRALS